ncbi:MAG: hypothetical protein C4533_06545 [Candidatus Omnitrophota bacterium]|jgi:hypothetical protein|nr:MAG: hypothetical protein C4533_06545 [Candidatus Omnitrophota bacterium]
MPKNIIIVAPHFPPSNMTVGHRCRYFANYLSKLGWKVKVLSVKAVHYEERLDPELEKLLFPELDIIRTKAFPVLPLHLMGDIGIRAFWWHYRILCDLAKRGEIGLLLIIIPPNYSALLGPLIYRKFKIPYIIDYVDPWIYKLPHFGLSFFKMWLSCKLAALLEPFVLKNVSLITSVAPGYYKGILDRYKWIKPDKCLALPYGADLNEFKYLQDNPRAPYLFNPGDGKLHIVYAGAMLPHAYSTLEAFMEALLLIKKNNPSFFNSISIDCIGTGRVPNNSNSFTVSNIAKRYNLLDIVHEFPERIPYLDTLNHLKYSFAVLIIGSSEPHYTPSKIFQAILSGRPVLGLLHSMSTGIDVIRDADAGEVITFDDDDPVSNKIGKIADSIISLINQRRNTEVSKKFLSNYSTEDIITRFSGKFKEILNGKNDK